MTKAKIKTDMAARFAQETKEAKKRLFGAVMSKEKVESALDVVGIYSGLTSRSKDCIVYERIHELAAYHFSPKEIMERLQVKK
jgi:trimethylamine:corrinoid methyltransferase-like protein